MKTIAIVLILLFLGSCENTTQKSEKKIVHQPKRKTFKLPSYNIKYSDSVQNTTLWKVDSIMPHYPFVLRYNLTFEDTLLHLELSDNRIRMKEDFFDLRERISEFEMPKTNDSDKLTILTDYTKNIKVTMYDNHYCYPVYVINNEKAPKLFTGKDSWVFAIQEALHPNGKWYPIEQRGFDFCGHGKWETTLNPKEYIVFFVPKYEGNYKTKIRIKIRTGGKIIFSEPIMGSISMKQFLFGSDKKKYVENPQYIKGQFYGGLPFEFDTEIYQKQPYKYQGYAVYSTM